MPMLTRQELYDLIWSEPAKTIAPRFGISDVALSKLCERHEVPQPPRGYWAKIAAGKTVAKSPLPPRGLGIRELVQPGRQDYWSYGAPPDLADAEIGPPPEFPESVANLNDRVREMVGKVAVPRDLSRAHHAIQALLDADAARRTKYLASSYRSSFDAPLFDSPFEKRRLCMMNGLLLALARLGTKPSLSRKHDPADFSVTVGHQPVSVIVDGDDGAHRSGWRSESDLAKPASATLRVTMVARAGASRAMWEDDKSGRVEDRITDIVVGVLVGAELAYREEELGRHKWLIQRKAQLIEERRRQAEERERKERERIAALEQARIDRLLSEADKHRRAGDIRAYVGAVMTADHLFGGDAAKKAQWSIWALAQADGLDPITSGEIGEIF